MRNRITLLTTATRPIITLLSVVVGLLAILEWTNRRSVVKSSQIERRTTLEIERARAAVPVGRKRILLVGNSLLLFAVDDSLLRLQIPKPWILDRVVLEQTYFLDWSYGFAGLYEGGARSAIEALMLDPGQLVGDMTRGDYTAFRLARKRDVVSLGEEAHLHPTEISRLVLSSWSSFYGFRGESRKVLLSKIIPGMSELAMMLAPRANRAAQDQDSSRLQHAVFLRLQRFRSESLLRGSRAVLILPPVSRSESALRAVVRAGREADVPVLLAYVPGSYVTSEFSDGVHLNAIGRSRFTRELVIALDSLLSTEFAGR